MIQFFKYEFQEKRTKINEGWMLTLQTLENYGQQQACQKEILTFRQF
jgi:hypothetical protein